MRRSFAGAGTALVTPFTKGGELDEGALRRLVRRQVEGGIDVLVPCGTTGESVLSAMPSRPTPGTGAGQPWSPPRANDAACPMSRPVSRS